MAYRATRGQSDAYRESFLFRSCGCVVGTPVKGVVLEHCDWNSRGKAMKPRCGVMVAGILHQGSFWGQSNRCHPRYTPLCKEWWC